MPNRPYKQRALLVAEQQLIEPATGHHVQHADNIAGAHPSLLLTPSRRPHLAGHRMLLGLGKEVHLGGSLRGLQRVDNATFEIVPALNVADQRHAAVEQAPMAFPDRL